MSTQNYLQVICQNIITEKLEILLLLGIIANTYYIKPSLGLYFSKNFTQMNSIICDNLISTFTIPVICLGEGPETQNDEEAVYSRSHS